MGKIFFETKEKSICKGEHRKSLILFLLDAVLINGAYVITTGVVLSGYVLFLGGQDFIVAILNNSTNFSTILCLFSFIIFERLKKRKKLLLIMNFISRTLIFLIIILPLIMHNKTVLLGFLAAMVIVSDIIWAIYRVGWIVWMMNIIPKESKTGYIYYRMFLVRLVMSIITMCSGIILDFFNKGYLGFFVVFGFSFVLSILDLIVLKQIEETEYGIPEENSGSKKLMFQPVKLKEYRDLLIFLMCFYLFQTMASSFTTIYLIKYLQFDYKFISTINVLSLAVMILSNRLWEKVEMRKGYKFVLAVTSFFIATELLVLSFLTRDTYYLLFVSMFVSGIGLGGFNVSIFTYRYELMPEGGKTMYEGWFYFSYGLGMLIAPFVGKAFLEFLTVINYGADQNSRIQLLYLVAFFMVCIISFINCVGYFSPKSNKAFLNE